MKKIPVPLLKQKGDSCGPTALAMVLKYFKNEIPISGIIKEVGGIKSYGVKTVTLAEYANKLGYVVHCYAYNPKLKNENVIIKKPSKELILQHLKKYLPVIITVRTWLLNDSEFSNEGHFIVITKFQNGTFWYNDPHSGREAKIKENDLMFSWYNNVLDSSAYMLVVKPKK